MYRGQQPDRGGVRIRSSQRLAEPGIQSDHMDCETKGETNPYLARWRRGLGFGELKGLPARAVRAPRLERPLTRPLNTSIFHEMVKLDSASSGPRTHADSCDHGGDPGASAALVATSPRRELAAGILRALGEHHRLAIVELLTMRGELCVTEFAETLQSGASSISERSEVSGRRYSPRHAFRSHLRPAEPVNNFETLSFGN